MSKSGPLRRIGLRVLIVDDEKLARDFLARMLSRNPMIRECMACGSAAEASARIKEFGPDILFLDVQMPGGSGFELLEMFDSEKVPIVIFTTAFSEFATRAFDVQACDYLLKPFDQDRLDLALDRAKAAIEKHTRSARCPIRITLPLGNRTVRLSAHEIDWISAEDNYVRIHRGRESMLVRASLGKLERDFKSDALVRVHRSYIVNIARIKEVRRSHNHQYSIILHDGSTVQCSRRFKHRLRMVLNS